jgi:hypothetical protein
MVIAVNTSLLIGAEGLFKPATISAESAALPFKRSGQGRAANAKQFRRFLHRQRRGF